MKKAFAISALLAAAAVMSGCSDGDAAAEIKIPILDPDSGGSFTTAPAERYDVEEYTHLGGTVDYYYAEALSVPCDTNVVGYYVKKGDRLNKGDVIAEFDSSSYNYEYQSQKIIADNAYARYLSSGSELDRLEYEQEAKRLEMVQYKIDLCTVRAPYDCIICATEIMTAGEAVTEGQRVCKVAKPDEVYITVKEYRELFAFGMPVSLKFGTDSIFSGKVACVPDTGTSGSVIIKLDEGELGRADEEAGSIATAGWCTVTVTDYHDYNVLCIPEDAVMTYSGETYCYIEENGQRIRVPIEAGKTVNGLTVILSGLSDGDTVSY